MGESQAKIYNDCNPRDDSYCIFEKDYKDLKEKIKELQDEVNRWNDIDFENLKLTQLKWNDDKTTGYKLAIHDFHNQLEQLLTTDAGNCSHD